MAFRTGTWRCRCRWAQASLRAAQHINREDASVPGKSAGRFAPTSSPQLRTLRSRLLLQSMTTDDTRGASVWEVGVLASGIKIERTPLPDEEPSPRWCGKSVFDRASQREIDGLADFAVGSIALEERPVAEVDSSVAINLCVKGIGALDAVRCNMVL